MRPDTPTTEVSHARAVYERHRAELEQHNLGKLALIHADELVGVYGDEMQAAEVAHRRFGLDQCWVQSIGSLEPSFPLWGPREFEDRAPTKQDGEAEVSLARELATYERYRQSLEREHLGKVVLIHEDELVGIFNDFDEAIEEGHKRFGYLEKLMAMEIGGGGWETTSFEVEDRPKEV